MQDPRDQQRVTADAREEFLHSGGGTVEEVPALVTASWRRSAEAGVDPSAAVRAAYHENLDLSSRLVRCAEPVIERVRRETADLELSIALTDSKARVLSRTDTDTTIGRALDGIMFAPGFDYTETGVGTNGVGTAYESGQPVLIVGTEHFHELLQRFACAGAPIRDPVTGRVLGVLDISSLAEHSSPLMHALVRSATHDIQQSLLLDRSLSQQALFETFVRLDARTHGAVMAVGGSLVMGNALAQDLFSPTEQHTIQEHARYLMAHHETAVDEIELASGKVVRMRGTRIVVGNDIAGMVLEVRVVSEGNEPTADTERLEDRTVPIPAIDPTRSLAVMGLRKPATSMTESLSPQWRRSCESVHAALAAHDPLLVMGETGTGKFSLVAEVYHRVSPAGRSLAIDAAGISANNQADVEEGLAATRVPTLFILRNIDELSTEGVEQLNDFLMAVADTDRPAYVAATLSDANLDSDLPFRDLLEHFQQAVTVPPLRHRTEDLPALVGGILSTIADRRDVKVSAAAMRLISRYSWPRNISQLQDALRSALLKRPVGELQPEDLPGYCHDSSRRQLTGIEALERDAIVNALRDAHGNRMQAAATLGIARSSLYRKLKAYGITTI